MIEVIFLVVILTSIRGYETFNRSSFAAMSMRKYVCGARRSFMRGGGRLSGFAGDMTSATRARGVPSELDSQIARMIHAMLPKEIARSLEDGTKMRDFAHDMDVALLQLDLVGFTTLTAAIGEIEIVQLLDRMYYVFDKIVENNGVYKVETIGDGAQQPRMRALAHTCAEPAAAALLTLQRPLAARAQLTLRVLEH